MVKMNKSNVIYNHLLDTITHITIKPVGIKNRQAY